MIFGKKKIWQLSSILRYIYKEPSTTRKQLSQELFINKSMVTKLTNQLIENKWLKEDSTKTKNVPLLINEKKIITAGIDIRPQLQTLVICDSEGEVIDKTEWKNTLTDIEGFILDPVSRRIKESKSDILGLGVSISGIKNYTQFSHIESPVSIENISKKMPESLQDSVIPVFYTSRSRCASFAEISYSREKKDFIYIHTNIKDSLREPTSIIEEKIDTTLILDQQIYEGSHNCAGRFQSILKPIESAKEFQIPGIENFNQFLKELIISFSLITSFLDIEKMFIGGTLTRTPMEYEMAQQTVLQTDNRGDKINPIEVCYRILDNTSYARGAAGMVLEKLLKEPCIETPGLLYKKITNTL